MSKLKVGDKFPNLTVETLNASSVDIKSLAGGKPTMVMVLRYIGCTVCRYDIHLLQEKYDKFTQKGVNVIVVMQSKPEIVKSDLNGNVLPFEFICDYNQEIYKTLEIEPAETMRGLVGGNLDDLKAKTAKATEEGFTHGTYEGIEEQLPAFFYFDKEMNVLEAHYAKTLMDMPTIDEMLEK